MSETLASMKSHLSNQPSKSLHPPRTFQSRAVARFADTLLRADLPRLADDRRSAAVDFILRRVYSRVRPVEVSFVTAHGVDAICAAGVDPTVTSRFVITPDPELDAPIALSAWRATYVATCIDLPSLTAFVDAHYGEAPENVCAQGKDPADPATGVLDCAP